MKGEDVLPCPFCGGGEFDEQQHTYWTGMRSQPLSFSLRHWCKKGEGILQSFFEIRGKTRGDAINQWNRRQT